MGSEFGLILFIDTEMKAVNVARHGDSEAAKESTQVASTVAGIMNGEVSPEASKRLQFSKEIWTLL